MGSKEARELLAIYEDIPEIKELLKGRCCVRTPDYARQVEQIVSSEPYTESEKAAHIEYVNNL